MEKLFLLDAYALIYRFYYAFINRPMRNAEGLNTSAIFGFVKFVNELIRREQPHYLGVAFDPKGGCFRAEIYPEYKANREKTPEDISAAVPYIKQILEAMRIPVLEVPGFEADDVIGTLSHKAADAGYEVFMVTPDKDFGQLIQPTVYIYKQKKGGEGIELVTCEKLNEVYGIDHPRQIIDILALWGDVSDNIPGVPGIGEKSAVKLVCEFGSVENLLANTDKLKGKQKENVEKCAEQIVLAKQLATIDINVPIDFTPQDLLMETPDIDMLADLYRELGFRSFLVELENNRYRNAALTGSTSVSPNSGTPAGVSSTLADPPAVEPRDTANQSVQRQALQGDLFASMGLPVPASPKTSSKTPTKAETGDQFAEGSYDTIDTVEHTYHTIHTPAALRPLCDRLATLDKFCFDTETAGFDLFCDRLLGISIAIEPHEAWYVCCTPEYTAEMLEMLKPIFENDRIAKIGQNLKFDIMVLQVAGIAVKGTLYDTMIIHYLLNPESRHNMDFLARTYLNYLPVPIEQLIGKGVKQCSLDTLHVDQVSCYSCEDADVTLQLYGILWPMLEQAGQVELYLTIEEPLIRVLADVELTGVKIDVPALHEYGKKLTGELNILEADIREMAGDPSLNVNSAKQLGEALFGRMKIDPKPKMTKTKQYRTDEEYLQSLSEKHPVIAKVLEYRGLKKLLSTYIEALPQLVNSCTGRIHTSFNQAVTATGRLSSTNPNLQNIPIRNERGREIRKAFIPSDSDHLILSADYSQVELRLMAHLSEDTAMLDAFARGADIHTATAARLFKVPDDQVTSDQRRKAKTANFGIIYGISAFGLAQRLHISRTEAKEIIDGYFASFPQVGDYMENVIKQAREDGFVTTLFGRKRMLPDINSGNAVVRGLAERNAINAPIQGGAADIMKLAMICVHRQLHEKGLKSRIILQVHDELVIDLLKSEEQQVRELVVGCMEGAAQLRVHLLAECGVGRNWVEAH